MQTKLTLRLDEALIRRAKSYARKSGKSVSQIVSDYFSLLDKQLSDANSELTPLVASLKGVLQKSNLDEHDYRNYLEEKYL